MQLATKTAEAEASKAEADELREALAEMNKELQEARKVLLELLISVPPIAHLRQHLHKLLALSNSFSCRSQICVLNLNFVRL